jgi:hypothetical protein
MEFIEEIVTAFRQLDEKGELKAVLTDEKIRAMVKETEQMLLQTLTLLETFGSVTQSVHKIRAVLAKPQDTTKTIQQRASLSPDDLLDIYDISLKFFSEQRYQEAFQVATLLTCLNPKVSSFWRMSGVCCWHQDNAKAALTLFLCASMQNALELENHLSVLDCFIKLGWSHEARNYHHLAKEVLTDAREWDKIPHLDAKIATL